MRSPPDRRRWHAAPVSLPTSSRLPALLGLLQQRREWSGPELAARLGVGPRTVRRDVDELRGLGYPIEAAPGTAGGYRLGAGTTLPPLLLDDTEAVAVAVGLRTAASGSISGTEETSAAGAGQARAAAARAAASPRFAYTVGGGRATRRRADPCALGHSGARWYLVAFDRDRGDWRTFRADLIDGAPMELVHAPRRTVPGGDPAAFVSASLDLRGESPAAPGRVRAHAPAREVTPHVPPRHATVEPDGEASCIATSHGRWSRRFLVWMALLDAEITVLGPPEMVADARRVATRLEGTPHAALP